MKINEIEISDAHQAWGRGLISISTTFDNEGIDKTKILANKTLDELYGFEFGPILFKPTLSSGDQTFRKDKDGTLSYFIGQNPKYPSDSGFALKSWRECKSETSSLFIENNIALWMGRVLLTNQDGEIVKVDKSWGYKRSSNGSLKIVLHHSSLPYQE